MKQLRVFPILIALALFGTGVAQADIVFNNFGPGDAYSLSGFYNVLPPVEAAMGFIPSETADLNSIDFVTSLNVQGNTNEVTLSLVNDSGGVPLGSTLESWTITGQMFLGGSLHPAITANSILHPLLQAGTLYWLIATSPPFPQSTSQVVWNMNSIGDTGPETSSFDNGATWPAPTTLLRGVFRVNATAVPEPSTLLLLGAGLAGVGLFRRRFKG